MTQTELRALKRVHFIATMANYGDGGAIVIEPHDTEHKRAKSVEEHTRPWRSALILAPLERIIRKYDKTWVPGTRIPDGS